MQVSVLGPIQVRDGDRSVELGGIKQRTLFALLVVAAGSALPVDKVIDQLWADEPPTKVMASVQSYIANLRRELEPHRRPRTPATLLTTQGGGYRLRLPPDAVDANRFAGLVARANAERPDQAIANLELALALWHGPAYVGLAESATAVAAESARLTELRWTAVERRWQLESDRGGHDLAAGELEKVVAEQPFRENAWALLAVARYRAQRQDAALAAVRRARTLLADRLGVDPGPALRGVEAAVLAQDDAVLLSGDARWWDRAGRPGAVAGPNPPAPEGPQLNVHVPGAPETVAVSPNLGVAAPADERLVGRASYLAAIDAAVRDAARDRGRLVLITGPAGIGKTLLAETALARAADNGALTVQGGWDAEGDAPPLWVWSELIAALRVRAPAELDAAGLDDGLAPLLGGGATPGQPVDGSAAFRLAGAVTSLLRAVRRSSGRPLVILLDDLQWADADSLRLMRRIANALPGLPVTLLITVRDPDRIDEGPLTETMAALARRDPTRIALPGLGPDELTEIAVRRCGLRPDRRVIDAILDRTDGNAFAAGQLLDLLAARGVLTDPGAAADAAVPDGVTDLVRDLLARLGATAREVAAAASVIGRTFSAEVLRQATGLSPAQCDQALDDAARAGLIVTHPSHQRFSHALIAESIYQRLSPSRRSEWHRRIGDAMLDLRLTGDEHAAELARHFQESGAGRSAAAGQWAHRAAEFAVSRAADEEAVRWFAAAVAADAGTESAPERQRLYRIRLGWGAALRRLGRERQAWQVLREAAELSLLAGDAVAAADALLVMTHDAIWIWRDYGTHLPDAIDLYDRVMDALPADQELLSAQLSGALAIETYYQPDDPGRSVALATDAVRIARRVGSPEELLDVLLLAHAAFERPELAQLRLSVATEAAALAERLGDRTRAARALCSRGCDRIGLGRYAEGDDDLRRAWELARAQRALPVMVVIGWARALLTSMSGDFAAGQAADADAAELHRLVEMTGGDLSVLHDWNRCWLQGRWQDAEPVLRNALSVAPSAGLRELHALTLVAAGRLPAAKASVGSWSEQPLPREDYLWLPTMVGRARLWSALGDDRAVAELRIALQPYLGELVIGGTGVVYLGLVDEAIGILAVAAGDLDQAVDHLRRSVRRYEEMGLLPSVAFASRRLSEVLRRSGMPADSAEVVALERRAAEIADRLDIDLPVASGCSGC